MPAIRIAALALSFVTLAGTASAAALASGHTSTAPIKRLLTQEHRALERIRVSPLMVYAVQSTHEASRKT